MPTLSGVKARENFLKGYQKDNWNLVIFSFKTKGETKIFNLQLWPNLKAGVMVSKLET
jgi:hypothetical protein